MRLTLGRALLRRTLVWLAALIVLVLTVAAALGAGPWLLRALTITLMLFLPGLALCSLLARTWDGGPTETLVLGLGLSLALYPLLLAWMTWAGGRWGPLAAAVLLAGSAFLIYAAGRTGRRPFRQAELRTLGPLALIFLLALALRLDHLRGILFPAWSDSYQHVTVSQLIIDGGRVPADYGPLVGIASFRYHFGFHSIVAFVAWLTRLPAHQSVLLTGQVLNALSCLTVYFLAAYGLEDRRAGLIGALIVGLLTIAPASYINYGRYPQLAGQVLLPVPMALTLRSLWRKEGTAAPWPLAAVSAAGLCLTHYRVVVFYACFVLALLLVLAWQRRQSPRQLVQLLLQTGRIALLAIALVAPWLVHLGQTFLQRFERSAAIAATNRANDLTWEFIFGWGASAPLAVGAAAGAVWGLVRRSGRIVALALWVGMLFLIANPRLLRVPTTFVTNGTVVLALYLPVGLLGGYLAAELLRAIERRWSERLATLALGAIVLLGCITGVLTLNRRILQPERFFVLPDDLAAYAWIREHIPADAVFAVQAYYEIGPHSAQGVDAGFWLPYTTGRRTTLPPMPYNGELTPEAADRISQRAADTARLPADHEALSRLKAEGVTHAYVVEPRISFFPGLWQPAQFAADPAYRLLYHQGSVWIFALDGAP